jgi:hypothetical protein
MPVLSLSKRPANKKTIAGMARSCTHAMPVTHNDYMRTRAGIWG